MKQKTLFISALTALSMAFGMAVAFAPSEKGEVKEADAWAANQTPNVTESYYAECEGKTGDALKSALAGINKPVSKSYSWSRYEAADEAQDDSSSIYCIYTRHNIKKSAHVGSAYSWDTWNREHVYTQTKFPNSDDDNHNIFACEGKINGTRSDKKFAEVGGTPISEFGHTTGCYTNSNYFEPCDEAKGEIARACMYCTIYYGYSLTQIFDSVETCIKWHAKFPVTAREIYRNNTVYGLQKNRNPFVDHPSYANAIFGAKYTQPDPLGGGTSPIDGGGGDDDNPPVVNTRGTANNPYTVAEALAVLETESSKADVYTRGTISSIREISPKVGDQGYGNATFSISDDGTTTSPQLLVYRGKYLSQEFFTSEDQIKVGDVVVMMGNLKNFTDSATGEITPEYDSNSYIYTLNAEIPEDWPGGGGDGGDTPAPTTKVLRDIEIDSYPTKRTYEGGEKFDKTGLKVNAIYQDNSKVDVTDKVTISTPNMNKKGRQDVIVLYKEGTVECKKSFQIIISSDAAGGCGGSIIAGSAIISLTSLLGASLLFYKKRKH